MFELIFIIILTGVAVIALSIIADILLAYHNRKCPYCGKRMKYQYARKDDDGDIEAYVFHCPHCGAFNNVSPVDLIRERHTKKN